MPVAVVTTVKKVPYLP
ncbi:hypothetical protein RSAG8_13913, partial [Rhizoctonia solani AG-8 WAC10335]